MAVDLMTTSRSAFLVAMATALTLGGCAGDANPMRDLAVAAGVTGGEPKPAPDFVSRSRTGSLDYVPVGTSAPKRVYRAKTAKEVGDAEKDLEGVRARNEAKGAAARAPAAQ